MAPGTKLFESRSRWAFLARRYIGLAPRLDAARVLGSPVRRPSVCPSVCLSTRDRGRAEHRPASAASRAARPASEASQSHRQRGAEPRRAAVNAGRLECAHRRPRRALSLPLSAFRSLRKHEARFCFGKWPHDARCCLCVRKVSVVEFPPRTAAAEQLRAAGRNRDI